MDQTTATIDRPTTVARRVPLRARRWIIVALVATAAAITLGPFPADLFDATHATLGSLARWLPGDVAAPPTEAQSEALLNLLVPILLVVAIAAGWPHARPHRLLAGAVLASVCIEAEQAVLPGRFAEVQDLVLNSAGALLGTVIFIAARRRWRAPLPVRGEPAN